MLNIIELLRLRGLDPQNARIKLVRHQDKRFDLWELLRKGHFDTYQSFQSRPVFKCDCIVSFMGLDNRKARLIGVYRVLGQVPSHESSLPPEQEYLRLSESGVHYTLELQSAFADLADRVVIDWGTGALAWHQWISPKEVVEVLPAGYVREFPGYLDFVLQFDDLKRIIDNPDPNREWHRALGSVAGVYLITDSTDGRQYVGSAYGAKGILGRWTVYASTGHGGNVRLAELLGKANDHARHFRFTILRTLPTSLTAPEVIRYEALYKEKLGSRAFGLNVN
jgi:hypothetical protein